MVGYALFTAAHHYSPLERTYVYKRNYAGDVRGMSCTVHLTYSIDTNHRNVALFLIPTMYYVAKGSREYYGETYGEITFNTLSDYTIHRYFATGNIAHYRRAMPIMVKYAVPDIYGVTLFGGHMLSPFNAENRKFYVLKADSSIVTFTPRLDNTQLVSGSAVIDTITGRVVRCTIEGEYDMLHFRTIIDMGDVDDGSTIPVSSHATAAFRFMGNDIVTDYHIDYRATLPDSVEQKPKEKGERSFAQRAWDVVGDNMLNSLRTESETASLRLSPILNPLYLNYSHSKGISYKMKLNARLLTGTNSRITFDPQVGYNFKMKKFFYTAPLRYTFDALRNRYIEVSWRNGNRITDSSVLEIIKDENRDTVDFDALNLNYFNDQQLKVMVGGSITRRVHLAVGAEFHERTAENRATMHALGKPGHYRSFAPQVVLTLTPPLMGLVVTTSYERSVKTILNSNMEYEKYEADIAYTHHLRGLRHYSLRLGGGFYTNQTTSYFVDFDNFRENYLPDNVDDWSGQFQLLNSYWYNASRYYLRANAAYVSPLLLLSWVPFIGRYVENERLYLSALSIAHTRPYFEVGYGITNRYCSIGLFGSFLNVEPYEVGCRFTFELFRNW